MTKTSIKVSDVELAVCESYLTLCRPHNGVFPIEVGPGSVVSRTL